MIFASFDHPRSLFRARVQRAIGYRMSPWDGIAMAKLARLSLHITNDCSSDSVAPVLSLPEVLSQKAFPFVFGVCRTVGGSADRPGTVTRPVTVRTVAGTPAATRIRADSDGAWPRSSSTTRTCSATWIEWKQVDVRIAIRCRKDCRTRVSHPCRSSPLGLAVGVRSALRSAGTPGAVVVRYNESGGHRSTPCSEKGTGVTRDDRAGFLFVKTAVDPGLRSFFYENNDQGQ